MNTNCTSNCKSFPSTAHVGTCKTIYAAGLCTYAIAAGDTCSAAEQLVAHTDTMLSLHPVKTQSHIAATAALDSTGLLADSCHGAITAPRSQALPAEHSG